MLSLLCKFQQDRLSLSGDKAKISFKMFLYKVSQKGIFEKVSLFFYKIIIIRLKLFSIIWLLKTSSLFYRMRYVLRLSRLSAGKRFVSLHKKDKVPVKGFLS